MSAVVVVTVDVATIAHRDHIRRIIVPYYEADVTVVKLRVCHRCFSYYCRRIIVSYCVVWEKVRTNYH